MTNSSHGISSVWGQCSGHCSSRREEPEQSRTWSPTERLGHCCDPARDSRDRETPEGHPRVQKGRESTGTTVWGHRAAPAAWQGHPRWVQAAPLLWCHLDRCHCNYSRTRSTPAFLSFLTNSFQLLLPPPGFALFFPQAALPAHLSSTARAERIPRIPSAQSQAPASSHPVVKSSSTAHPGRQV